MRGPHYPQATASTPAWPARWALACLAIGLALSGCSTHGPSGRASPAPSGYGSATDYSRRANDVLVRSIGLVGTPYRYGGNTP